MKSYLKILATSDLEDDVTEIHLPRLLVDAPVVSVSSTCIASFLNYHKVACPARQGDDTTPSMCRGRWVEAQMFNKIK